MLSLSLHALGWLLAHLPEPALRLLAATVGQVFLVGAPRRRRLVLSNLEHAFPDRPPAWRKRMARLSFRRLVETGLLALAAPHLSENRARRIAKIAPEFEAWARERAERPHPTVFGTVHCALWETQTWVKLLCPVPAGEFGVVFRPLDRPEVDAYIKRTRERFGPRLLSRKEGFAQALGLLRRNQSVALLFDQNAGDQGALTLFFGRVCSTTELPGLLASKFGAEVRAIYPRRTGFWRATIESRKLEDHDGTPAGITFALNRWLEKALAESDELCASWLWSHNRWRHQDRPERRFRLESRRDLLAQDLRSRGLAAPPRRTRLWIRLPNWLGDVMMTLPLLRALRAGRPDAEIVLVANARFLPLLAGWGVADRLHPLPPRGRGYFGSFRRLRSSYPDVWLLFTHSFRGDVEAWLTRTPQRFGLERPGKSRPLLSHACRLSPAFDQARPHQIDRWGELLRAFGLAVPIDRSPLPFAAGSAADESDAEPGAIGLIFGSENNPAKRWPIEHWRRLIDALPGERFVLFGTAGDAPLAAEIAAGFPDWRIEDLAGKTDLPELARRMRSCRLIVANDTGGMHLANALGVPLLALFGPTNPLATGPVFTSPHRILQPPGCPPAGGAPLAGLKPETVAAAVEEFCPKPKAGRV